MSDILYPTAETVEYTGGCFDARLLHPTVKQSDARWRLSDCQAVAFDADFIKYSGDYLIWRRLGETSNVCCSAAGQANSWFIFSNKFAVIVFRKRAKSEWNQQIRSLSFLENVLRLLSTNNWIIIVLRKRIQQFVFCRWSHLVDLCITLINVDYQLRCKWVFYSNRYSIKTYWWELFFQKC